MKFKDACSWKKSYDKPRQHIKKQRHYFANKALSSQSYCFPVVMYECESWTIKKAECQRTDAFELWCWRRLLRVPWTAKSLQMVTAAMKLKDTCSLEKKSYDQTRQFIKKQRNHFANKGPSNQSYGFYGSHIGMWKFNHKEGWVPKNWCFLILALQKTLESPFDSKEIKTVNPKGNQPSVFIGKTDAEAETSILWPPHAKSWFTGKDPDARKDWRQKKGVSKDNMVRSHHWLNGHEFEQTLRVS